MNEPILRGAERRSSSPNLHDSLGKETRLQKLRVKCTENCNRFLNSAEQAGTLKEALTRMQAVIAVVVLIVAVARNHSHFWGLS